MGQYYHHVNVDKKQAYSPNHFGGGIKLMEHSWVGNRTIQALDTLLRGEWKGDRVVVAGDYFEADENKAIGIDLDKQLYDVEWDAPKLEVPEATKALVKKWEKQQMTGFYVNYDAKEFIDLSELPVEEVYNGQNWIISPLTLMIACGNNRGGGDFYDNGTGFDLVGTWAGDHVGIEAEAPKDYQEVVPAFSEGR